ncbi:MAG: hypothetical protein ABSG13_12395 [Bryobacteraceae bacterium]
MRGDLPLVDAYLQAGLDALGDATRMAIFQKLAGGPVAVNKLERHGEGYEQLRAMFDGPGAWGHILELYAKAAGGGR